MTGVCVALAATAVIWVILDLIERRRK